MSSRPLTLGSFFIPASKLSMSSGRWKCSPQSGNQLQTYMVAEYAGPVPAGIVPDGPVGPCVTAEFGFDDAPQLDLLLIPGGIGTFPELANERMLAFLRERGRRAQITASVCTGSALLAKAGVLDGHRATSNKQFFNLAAAQSSAVEWVAAARWVDDGNVVTSSGVSAGMDMALAIIERLFVAETAERIAVGTEYTRHRDADNDPFVAHLNQMAPMADAPAKA
jgi:transcriptional regulator GlxA family with amidase domain